MRVSNCYHEHRNVHLLRRRPHSLLFINYLISGWIKAWFILFDYSACQRCPDNRGSTVQCNNEANENVHHETQSCSRYLPHENYLYRTLAKISPSWINILNKRTSPLLLRSSCHKGFFTRIYAHPKRRVWACAVAKLSHVHNQFRPSQLNYMLHGCKRVSFCENL